MNSQKIKLIILLITLSFVSQVKTQLSQRVTIPLRQFENGEYYFPVTFGEQGCVTNVTPGFGDYCSNYISDLVDDKTIECGVDLIGYNAFTQSRNYHANFSIGNTYADLTFSIPYPKSRTSGRKSLCFGFQEYTGQNGQDNTVTELYSDMKINQQIVYVNLNNTMTGYNDTINTVGELDVGKPNPTYIKSGQQFVELKNKTTDTVYNAENTGVYFFGRKLKSYSFTHFSMNSPFTELPREAINQIFEILEDYNIAYSTVSTFDNYLIYLNSIRSLQNLDILLTQTDGSLYKLTLDYRQLTRKLPNGQYQLLVKIGKYGSFYIVLGNTVFNSYYLGFNVPNQSVSIVEKNNTQNTQGIQNNFRGSSQILY